MRIIYIDESGYTGADLLNKDQPFQAASAISIAEDDAKAIVAEFFLNSNASELKYRDLAKRKRNWERLYLLQKALLENFDCVTYVCDKKFILILHFLDYAVEPFYYDRGIDFYQDGCNYSLASLVYYAGPTLIGKENLDDILYIFQSAVKSKSEVSVSALVQKVKAIRWQELPECFGPLALETESCIDAIKTENVSTDAALIVLLSLINRLEEVVGEPYSILHDRSKNLEQYSNILQKMASHDAQVEFYGTELATTRFPLHLHQVSQVDSRDYLGVQLADILVGGIIDSSKAITGVKVNDYNKSIPDLYKDNQLIHLLPSLDFKSQKQFRKNTQGGALIDYFATHFS